MANIKITVMKRMFNPELVNEYSLPGNTPCELFSEGQEFIVVQGLFKPKSSVIGRGTKFIKTSFRCISGGISAAG